MLDIGAHNGRAKVLFFSSSVLFLFRMQKERYVGRVALSYLSCAMACEIKNIYIYMEINHGKSNQSSKTFSNMSRKAKVATVGKRKGMYEKSNFSGFVLVQQLCAEVNHNMENLLAACTLFTSGLGSVVGIAIAYGLDGSGIESRWGEIFRTIPDRP